MKQIEINQEDSTIIINGVSIEAEIVGEPGQRMCSWTPTPAFWKVWTQYEPILKFDGITIWRNPYNDEWRCYYDELKIFADHEQKWLKKKLS